MSISANRRRPIAFAAFLLLTALASMGCGGSTSGILNTVGAPIGSAGAAAPAPAATAAPNAPAAGQLPAGDGSTPAPGAASDALKIVYTGSLDLLVDDLDAALAKGRTTVLATGGYIGGSDESRTDETRSAVISYRIPASRWEDALTGLRGIAKAVAGEKTQAAEVGGQIVDLEARLRNLRASEQVLVGIAEKTDKVADLLEVQQRISDVRGQIEQLDGQRAALEDQVAYGTLVTTFVVKIPPAPVVEKPKVAWDPAKDVAAASARFTRMAQRVVSGAIWFAIVWLPILAVGLVGLVAAAWVVRRLARGWLGNGPTVGVGSDG